MSLHLIVLTCDEDGSVKWKVNTNLYDMLTEGERKKIEQLAKDIFSCEF